MDLVSFLAGSLFTFIISFLAFKIFNYRKPKNNYILKAFEALKKGEIDIKGFEKILKDLLVS